MASLTFYGGAKEIGGNKILLEDSGTKIFLDFGMSFGQANKFFSEFLQPRKCNGVGDFIEFGLLPDLKGLYRRDYIKHMGRKVFDTEFHGVLLTHAHADHAAYIHHLREDIPIYCSEPTKLILKALNDTAATGFAELTELKESFCTYLNKSGFVSKKNSRTHPNIVVPRKFEVFNFGRKFKIDNLEIIPYNVDHSLPGATGYIIHTSEGTIVYTGDMRFHGRRGGKTEEFMEKCAEEKPDILLCEGTRVNEESSRTEEDVEDEVSMIAKKANGLAVCNWPVRDTDRMMSFFNASKKIGRILAIDLKQAYVIDLLKGCKDAVVPDLNDENIRIYAMRKTWGVIGSDFDKRIIHADYENWERGYLKHPNLICHKDVVKNQKKYLFFCNNFELKELVDVRPLKGSVYIKSVCEPFDMEMEIDWERISNWIEHFGMDLHRTHVSGHASGPQLKEFARKINAKKLIPIHTEHPEFFEKFADNVQQVKAGEKVEV